MTKYKRNTITAALPYANGPVHIGHIAGCYLPADIYARYLRLKNEDVAFICGSDEHGVPITIKAKSEGISPQEVVDKYHLKMKNAFADFGISFDHYSRTSSKTHHETASDFFKTLYEKGVFTEKETEQYFDEKNQQFLADRYIEGTCPKCAYEHAYGDQCESCGTSLSPEDLINPKSKLSGETPIKKLTKHWFLPLNEYSDWLRAWIVEGKEKEWKSNVYGQCKSWLNNEDGLQPRAMTRDLDWGVKVPLENAEGKVLYVWFDAPIGYISATKEWAAANNKNWEDYWKKEDTKLVHFIGKDNIVFHCIIFPSILKAHGDYILPDNVPANEFLNLEGRKLSTSRNWAVWLHEYLEEFPGKQDELRYVLTSIAPETKDSDFSWKDYQARINNELVAILGNFVNRVIVLSHKYYDGIVPETKSDEGFIKNNILPYYEKIESLLSKYQFRQAQAEFMNLAREGNQYLQINEPWKLIKTDEEKTKEIIFTALQITAHLSSLAKIFLPFTAQKLNTMLNTNGYFEGETNPVKNGVQFGEALLLFQKIEDEAVEIQIEKLKASELNNAAQNNAVEESVVEIAPAKETISYEDFAKLDIRTGKIVSAEKVKKADKLLELKIDIGFETRTVVSGIANFYNPENIIGQQVLILINLAPRKLKGIESQGMILMAEDANGNLKFVAPIEDIAAGSGVA
jgi:methionyl-tRNA synthetase